MNILRRASRAATAMWTVAALIAASAAAACRTESPPPSAPLSTPPAATARPEVPSQSTTSGTPFTPPPAAYNGVLPSLPSSSFPPARPPDVVQAVYTFAARHPEVLHYVPCFCGCQHSGHRDNDDCFISGREADGKPRWEPHGMT